MGGVHYLRHQLAAIQRGSAFFYCCFTVAGFITDLYRISFDFGYMVVLTGKCNKDFQRWRCRRLDRFIWAVTDLGQWRPAERGSAAAGQV